MNKNHIDAKIIKWEEYIIKDRQSISPEISWASCPYCKHVSVKKVTYEVEYNNPEFELKKHCKHLIQSSISTEYAVFIEEDLTKPIK